ncbi:hypothetical protein ACJZ2D_003336 [Fusarium nematophilum]
MDALLWKAVSAAGIPEIFFALEDTKIDLNVGIGSLLEYTRGDAFLCSLLAEAGAKIETDHLMQSLEGGGNDIAHWFFFYGAESPHSHSSWQSASHGFWAKRTGDLFEVLPAFDFVRLEGILSHLLWHGSDPNEVFQVKREPSITKSSFQVDTAWEKVQSGALWHWPLSDIIHWAVRLSGIQEPFISSLWPDLGDNESTKDVEYEDSEDATPRAPEDEAFYAHDLFFDTVSSRAGRRQLVRFPFVRLLVNALQLAGYRAEMDDEGDVWYGDEDGDQYFGVSA